jgi:uncharacterized membrane protein
MIPVKFLFVLLFSKYLCVFLQTTQVTQVNPVNSRFVIEFEFTYQNKRSKSLQVNPSQSKSIQVNPSQSKSIQVYHFIQKVHKYG